MSPTFPHEPAEPFLAIGATAVVAGGTVAAVTGPAGWEHGSWVAAFLVLVVGVGQAALGAGQAALDDRTPSRRLRGAQAVTFDGGAGLVVAGTLAGAPVVVTLGCLAVLAALALFARAVLQGTRPPTWPARACALVLAVLIVSTPIGIALAWLRT